MSKKILFIFLLISLQIFVYPIIKESVLSFYNDFLIIEQVINKNTPEKVRDALIKEFENDKFRQFTLVSCAMIQSDKELLSSVTNYYDINIKNQDGLTPFMFNLFFNKWVDFEFFEYLFENGVDVNEKTYYDQTALMFALYGHDNYDLVKFLVEKGADVNAYDKDLFPVISYSAHNTFNPEIMEYLIKCGADVNFCCDAGFSPLLYSVNRKDYQSDLIWMLIKNGADIHHQCNEGKNVLMHSCYYMRDIEIYKYFINQGVDINHSNKYSQVVMQIVLSNIEDINIINLFIESGVNLNKVNDLNKTPLFYAVQYQDNLDILKKIISKSDINHEDIDGLTPIFYSIGNYTNFEVFEFLIKNGANIKHKTDVGINLLMSAILDTFNPEIIDRIINLGINVNDKTETGNTALTMAIVKKRPYWIIKALIEKGADLKTVVTDQNLLHLAIRYHPNPEVTKLLINKGVNVNEWAQGIYNNLGFAALFTHNIRIFEYLMEAGVNIHESDNKFKLPPTVITAAFNPEVEILKLFIEKGGNIKYVNEYGSDALYFAAMYNKSPTVIKYLIDEFEFDVNRLNKEKETPLIAAISNANSFEIIDTLLEKGALINKTGRFNNSPLVYAALYSKKPETIDYLVSKGGDINITSNSGLNPLMYAAQKNTNKEFLTKIIENGVKIDSVENTGKTAIFFAIFNENFEEVISMLVELGADINHKDIDGKTPVMYALENNAKPEIINSLLKNGASVRSKDDFGKNAIIYAAQYTSYPEIIRLIIDYGGDINFKHKIPLKIFFQVDFGEYYERLTPLFVAVRFNQNVKVIDEIIKSGANLNYKVGFFTKKNVITYAEEFKVSKNVIELLRSSEPGSAQ